MALADNLLAIDECEHSSAWEAFFLNEAMVKEFLETTPKEQVVTVLEAGQRLEWTRLGHN
jgi:hypothetical protein